MALSNVTFLRGEGGLGRPLAGEDHVSGLVAYFANASLPSGFGTSDRIKTVFSISEAETLGIAEGSATHGVLWYHIDRFFKAQPKGELFIGLFDNAAIDYSVVETVQAFANGRIRQIGVFDETAFATATLTTLQASATALEAIDQPLSILYAGDYTGVADLSTLSDLRTLSNKNVSAVLGEDGNAAGAALAVSSTKSVTALGTALGMVSLSNVHENIGWVAKFNVVDGAEFDVPAFANGSLVKDASAGLVSGIAAKGYIILTKYVGSSGTYFNDSSTAIALTSDFAYIENNRVIDKAVRGVRTFMLPNLNSPILVNGAGQLPEATIAVFKNDADRALEQMLIDGEVSSFQTDIDPTQDVLASSKVEISIKIVPVGVARTIEVKIGFTVSL